MVMSALGSLRANPNVDDPKIKTRVLPKNVKLLPREIAYERNGTTTYSHSEEGVREFESHGSRKVWRNANETEETGVIDNDMQQNTCPDEDNQKNVHEEMKLDNTTSEQVALQGEISSFHKIDDSSGYSRNKRIIVHS